MVGQGIPAMRLTIHAVDLDGKAIPANSDEFNVLLGPQHLAGKRFSVDLSSWVCPAYGHYQVRVSAHDDPASKVPLLIPFEVRP
jgi:hypothetical protein